VIEEKDYRTISPTSINIYTAKADYSQNLFKGKLGAGFKVSWVKTDNTFDFYNVTDGVDVLSVAERGGIGGADRGVKGGRGAAPLRAQRVIDHCVRSRADQPFGQWLGLGQQRPWPEPERETIVGAVPDGVDREHVKDRERVHVVRVVERGPIGDAATAIMTSDEEVLELEGAKTVAAIIVEPVVGTNGVLIPPDGYMQGLRALCDKPDSAPSSDSCLSVARYVPPRSHRLPA